MNRSLVRAAACTLAAAAVSAVLLAVPASTPSQAASITISDPNCAGFSWDAVNNVLSCTGGGGGGGAISCSIALSNGSPTVSTAETLTANCSGATGTVTYAWSAAAGNAGACPQPVQEGASPNKADVAAPGGSTALNCTYKLTANDSGTNTSSTPSKAISYTTGGGGGGGGGGNISCNGFTTTHVISAVWANGLYYTSNVGGFGPNDAVVVKFTTSGVTSSTKTGYVQAVEYGDPTTHRYGALSDTPCDFNAGLATVAGLGIPAGRTVFYDEPGPWTYFSVANPKAGAATLQPLTTYYFNMANMPGACGGSCNMLVTFSKPGGT